MTEAEPTTERLRHFAEIGQAMSGMLVLCGEEPVRAAREAGADYPSQLRALMDGYIEAVARLEQQSAATISAVLIVTDGQTIRTIHPPAMGEHRAAVEAIARTLVLPEEPEPPEAASVAPQSLPPVPAGGATATMTQGEMFRAQGYTGDACTSCHGFRMLRTGTCVTCQDCSHNAGCG